MFRILVVEGNTREKCAEARAHNMPTQSELYVETLRSLNPDVLCDVVKPADHDSALPTGAAIKQYAGIAWTGSSLNIYHATPEIVRQVEFAKACFAAEREIFGSCWGLQVAAVATGGVVSANSLGREIGIARKIELTDAGAQHDLYHSKAHVFDSVAIHLDHITTLPADSTVLARNDHSEVQALEIRRGKATFWGVQYHPEFDLAYIAGLMRRYQPLMLEEGLCKDEATLHDVTASFDELSAQPQRADLRWRLGIDDDVLDAGCRLREIGNWLQRAARQSA